MEPSFVLAVAKRRSPERLRGFTLIEVVVVVVILTIILGMMGVQLRRDPAEVVHDEAKRLALVLQNAQQQAILEGRPYAFSLTHDGYRFFRLNEKGHLAPIEADELLAPHRLPPAITLAPASQPNHDDAKHADLVLFDPSGEFAGFLMVFETADIVWYVQGRSDGKIQPLAESELTAG